MHATPLFLTGMMGSGKSTVGRLLAERREAVFVDLDGRIERIFGTTVASLFAAGEDRFRARERAALVSLAAEPGFAQRSVVVATGGGVVIDPRNLETMHGVGTTVFIDVPVDELVARLHAAHETGVRPLLQGGTDLAATLSGLLTARTEAYAACRVRVDGTGEPQSVAERIERALAELGAEGGGP